MPPFSLRRLFCRQARIRLDCVRRASDECVCEEKEMIEVTSSNEMLSETADLDGGFLIVESADNTYQPVARVATIREAREIAAGDLRSRMSDLDAGREPVARPVT
jgi:hypothetical protein